MEENSRSEEEDDNQVVVYRSSSRALRNQAEKQRRDKMNQAINELALLVPTIKASTKKVDKTSVLRLSASFLRAQYLSMLLLEMIGRQVAHYKRASQFLHDLYQDMDVMLLAVTASGKIVFITDNVEQVLGHHVNDLLGSTLSEITHPEDLEKFKYQMKPEDQDTLDNKGVPYCDRRSFTLRVKLRSASKSDQPQYMNLKLEGHIRIATSETTRGKPRFYTYERYFKSRSQANGKADNGLNPNDIVLIGFLKEYKPPVPSNAVLESSKEEWLSRHLLDGTIVFSDHRIAHMCGYMSDEVRGEFAFKFIHKDDARWVMIALRQMFNNKEAYGWSAYRLQQKNGEYIYLRTEGYLEIEEGTQNAKSFICINTHVGEKEGKKLISEMKKKFTPIVTKQNLPLASPVKKQIELPSPSPQKPENEVADSVDLQPLETSEPQELNSAVELMFSKFDQVIAQLPPPEKRDRNFTKVEFVSKFLPPIQIPSPKAVSESPSHVENYNRPSVITSITGSGERPKRPPDTTELTHKTEIKRLRSESGSVIISDKRSVIKKNEPDSYDFQNSFENCDDFMINQDLLLLSGNSSFSNISDDDSIRIPDDVDISGLWDAPPSDLERGVLKSHIRLENRIQSQGAQIVKLEEDLDTIPICDSSLYRNHITSLKAEYEKQQKILKTLQHDHQIIQKL